VERSRRGTGGIGVVVMETNKNICTDMDEKLADLLLDPSAVPENVTTHVAGCDRCHRQLEELRSTMALLDTWEAPEPNPFFMTRFQARLEEERKAAPAGWAARLVNRVRARVLYGPQLHARPLAAMALTFLLILGGGAYLGVTNWEDQAQPSPQAAVVGDLENLDNNAQLLDQLEDLTQPADAPDDDLSTN
jgi:hypothetical protein